MSLTTVAVSIAATYFNAAGLANGRAHFELTGPDVDGTLIVPQAWDAQLDAAGAGSINLWPNSRGKNGTQYRVTLYDYAGVQQYAGVCTVPTAPCALHTIVSLAPPASVSDAQAASSAAQAYAAEAATSAAAASTSQQAAAASAGQAQAVLTDPGFVAVSGDLVNIDAVAASVANVNTVAVSVANVNAVGSDVANINAVAADLAHVDVAAANIAAINGAAGNAAAAAASAAAAAASAASVATTAIYEGMVRVLGLFAHNHAAAVATNTQNFNSEYVPLISLGAI